VEIPCNEKTAKSETSNYGLRFLRFFFEMPFQKNVKIRVFWIFKKNVKNVFSNYDGMYTVSSLGKRNSPNTKKYLI